MICIQQKVSEEHEKLQKVRKSKNSSQPGSWAVGKALTVGQSLYGKQEGLIPARASRASTDALFLNETPQWSSHLILALDLLSRPMTMYGVTLGKQNQGEMGSLRGKTRPTDILPGGGR